MSLLQKNWFLYGVIFVLAVLQYANTRDHDFAWDDAIVITENSRVQKGWSDIPELFENIKTTKIENRYGYRPISLLSYATDVKFFGVNSQASHRVNIILYGMLCVLVFLFLQSVFPDRKIQNLLVTILFLVHPLHTEVVANIKSRDEILAMLFGLVGLLFYRQALIKRPITNYFLFAFFLLVAFLSKENAVVFCGVAFLMSWYVNATEKSTVSWLRRLVPLVSSFALLIAIRLYVYSDSFFQNTDQELFEKGVFLQDGFVGNPLFGIESDFFLKWLNIIYLNGYHFLKFLFPYPLVHDYGYNYLELVDFTDFRAHVGLIFLAALVFITVKEVSKRSTLGFGLAFFGVTASIYLHVAGLAPDIFAERFSFVSSLGLSIAMVSMVFAVSSHKRYTQASIALLLMVSVVYSVHGHYRNRAWKNNETLFRTDLSVLGNGARIHYNYALLLHGKYYEAPEEERPVIQDSILHYYEKAVSITDRLLPAYMDLGGAYMEFGKSDKAKEIFQKTIDLHPSLSAPYVQMGKCYMTEKEFFRAIPYFQKAIENGEKNSDYYYLLAICQFNSDQREQAIQTLKDGEGVGVPSPSYYGLMVKLQLKLGNLDAAESALGKGLDRFPSDAELMDLKRMISVNASDPN